MRDEIGELSRFLSFQNFFLHVSRIQNATYQAVYDNLCILQTLFAPRTLRPF
jgi:hypothetical protein